MAVNGLALGARESIATIGSADSGDNSGGDSQLVCSRIIGGTGQRALAKVSRTGKDSADNDQPSQEVPSQRIIRSINWMTSWEKVWKIASPFSAVATLGWPMWPTLVRSLVIHAR